MGRLQAVETGQDQALQRIWHAERGDVGAFGQLPATILAVQEASVNQHAQDLFQIEGHTRGALDDLFAQHGRQLGHGQQACQHLETLLMGQALQRDDREAVGEVFLGPGSNLAHFPAIEGAGDAQDKQGHLAD